MNFMQWALQQTSQHPALKDALVTANGQWLEILLPDGRTTRFRPAALIREDASEQVRAQLLHKLLDIAIAQAHMPEKPASDVYDRTECEGHSNPAHSFSSTPASHVDSSGHKATSLRPDFQPQADTPIVPIVRGADYFLRSHRGEDSMVYMPLTDFVGVGLAYDLPAAIHPMYYSHLEEHSADIGNLLEESVFALRALMGGRNIALSLEILRIAGAEVAVFLEPHNYELSWMCDVEVMMNVAESVQERHPESIPLFVPAARTKFYVVFSEDPHLVDFFKLLLAQRESSEAVYPLPHTVAADGWKEWVPFPGTPLAEVLGALRGSFRQDIYAKQVELCEAWDKNFGAMKSYEPQRLKSGERVSSTVWDCLDRCGSIPDTDFITFMRAPSPHPWEDSKPVQIAIRSHIAREIWPEGIVRDETFWPPRWKVAGFPDEKILARLAESADREF